MLKHALAVGTLAASGLIVAVTMSAQPASASAITQKAASLSGLLNDDGRGYGDNGDPYDHHHPYGHVSHYVPYGHYSHYDHYHHYDPHGHYDFHGHHSPYGPYVQYGHR
ncbi:hypothetical protein AB0J63_48705 [Streptosporangium canum]|uniref:hypothetical protein n=1 Tax=Streptosporangium canum TaxID=324952 RepID=UPI00343EC9F4